ncbi:MAG TPA: uroporphyrinogen-III synthase [Paenalcaligenes sp.]|nr:uroporphyrinogen-III synthase [Paenalcaligenes sp.]
MTKTVNRTVILTRPEQRNQPLAQALADTAIENLSLPALEVVPLVTEIPTEYLPGHYDLVIFVSGQAARCYLNPYYQKANDNWPVATKIGTVGVSTRQIAQLEIEQYQPSALSLLWRHPPAGALSHDSEALWEILRPELSGIHRALVVRGKTGREWLRGRLLENDVAVDVFAVYDRRAAFWPLQIGATIQRCAVNGLVFLVTSSESAQAIFENLQRLNLLAVCQKSIFVVIHERIEKRVQSLWHDAGFANLAVVKRCIPTHESMLTALVQAAASPQVT